MYSWGPLETIASAWGRVVDKNKDKLFFATLAVTSLVALLPFARQTSMSNYFVYALFPIIYVFANARRFDKIESPGGFAMLLALIVIAGSFLFNVVAGVFVGTSYYGLTDYVILVVGIFALFYTIENSFVRFGVYLLVFVRGGTLALGMLSSSLYTWVSNLFVGIVVFFSKTFVSPSVHSGAIPGQVIVTGAAGTQSVGIGWACAGLEELVITTVLILILIRSFDLTRNRTTAWLAIGVAGSFLINITRMVILVWVAGDYGIQKMLWVHTHLGDVLFLVWIGVFWLLFFKLGLPKKATLGPARLE